MSDRLRKSTKKQVISIILVLTLLLSVILSGCHGQSSEIQNKKFRKFTETLFCQEVASNTVSLHYTLKDPGQYGIQDSPVTFGYFNTDKGTRKIFHRKYTGGIETIFLSEIIKGKQAYI